MLLWFNRKSEAAASLHVVRPIRVSSAAVDARVSRDHARYTFK